jgi:DNA invertase Pin-like site-specific DNA recombinase
MGKPRKPGVVGYIRVCTDEFAGSEPDYNTQREAILAESQRRELPLLYFFLDQRPCPSQHTELAQSPGLHQALTALGEGQGSVLAVANPRRLPEDAAKLIRLGRQQGWELIPLHVAPRPLPPSKAPPRRRASAFTDEQRRLISERTKSKAPPRRRASAFTDEQRRLISERTKAALAIRAEQGVRLGRPPTVPALAVEYIVMARDRGYSWSSIARALNQSELDPAQGGRRWYASTVRAIYLRQTLGRGGSQPVRDEASDDN